MKKTPKNVIFRTSCWLLKIRFLSRNKSSLSRRIFILGSWARQTFLKGPLDLPETAFIFTYNGTNSEVAYPKGLRVTSSNSYDNQKLKGFNGNQNAGATVNIQARFSDVRLK